MSSRFHFGQITNALVSDGGGRAKERPVVIIDGDEACRLGDDLLVIPITKSIQRPIPYYHILVHDSHSRDPVTGLYYPCVAKCDWYRVLEQTRLRGNWGTMPGDLLSAIVDAYDQLLKDPDFDDWQ